MPVVFRHDGIRFYFFSHAGNPRTSSPTRQPASPIHVHAGSGDAEAKFWLNPDVRIAESSGFTRREQADPVRIVTARLQEIMEAWHEHFG